MYRVVISRQTDPLLNLALESWLFEHAVEDDAVLLYLWINRPSVFMGRFQNPWQECRLPVMRERGLPLYRRNSGGGCVYHDEGNINFTFLSPRGLYDKTRNLDFWLRFLASPGVDIHAGANMRHDLIIPGSAGIPDRKFSGSAYREKRDRAYHHGTLLVDADLGVLRSLLRPKDDIISTRATDSVRSRVVNLSELNPGLTRDSFYPLFGAWCREQADISEDIRFLDAGQITSLNGILELGAGFDDTSWIFQKTPAFQFQFKLPDDHLHDTLKVSVNRGRVMGLTLSGRHEDIEIDLPEPLDLSDPLFSDLSEPFYPGLGRLLKGYI